MRWFCFFCLWAGLSTVVAQERTLSLDELLDVGRQFIEDNVDTNVLNSLPEIDQTAALEWLRRIEAQFDGEYVVDLAAFRNTAYRLVPLLESLKATRPYAFWLKSRLDYFDAAEQFQKTIPQPKPTPGKPPPPRINPTPKQQQTVWDRQLEKKPQPAGSAETVMKLKPLFSAQKVPPQLVWLAEVESGFKVNAVSPVGAAGLFQLMPQTATAMGLSLKPKDERFDPEKSARAAAKYLKYLHNKFKDWPLALAAYNAGEGRVGNLLKKYKTNSFNGIAIHLPSETQMYVPKIDATIRKREGMSLGQLSSR